MDIGNWSGEVPSWYDAIRNNEELPIGISPGGVVYGFEASAKQEYRIVAGMAGKLDDNVDRAENLLASDAIGIFLDLWQITKQDRFKRAAERLIEILSGQLRDADSGSVAHAIWMYRRLTKDTRFDQGILDVALTLEPSHIERIGMDLVDRPGERPRGVGKRNDAPLWFENGKPRSCNAILLAVAAGIKQDKTLAAEALDLARTYFRLGCENLSDGRDHGCAANTVNAVARGHGRENKAGMTTAVLATIAKDFEDGLSQENGKVLK